MWNQEDVSVNSHDHKMHQLAICNDQRIKSNITLTLDFIKNVHANFKRATSLLGEGGAHKLSTLCSAGAWLHNSCTICVREESWVCISKYFCSMSVHFCCTFVHFSCNSFLSCRYTCSSYFKAWTSLVVLAAFLIALPRFLFLPQ